MVVDGVGDGAKGAKPGAGRRKEGREAEGRAGGGHGYNLGVDTLTPALTPTTLVVVDNDGDGGDGGDGGDDDAQTWAPWASDVLRAHVWTKYEAGAAWHDDGFLVVPQTPIYLLAPILPFFLSFIHGHPSIHPSCHPLARVFSPSAPRLTR